MNGTDFTPARAFYRLLAIRTEGWGEAERDEAEFDGGEWSGPAWSQMWERAMERAELDIAAAFDMDYRDVQRLIAEYEHREYEHCAGHVAPGAPIYR